MIEAGAAAVHFEDQLASAKKCGHMGGKVLVPTQEFIQKLVAARLAADVMGVDTILIARTDADAAGLITSDIDERDHQFLTGNRTPEGFFSVKPGLNQAIARALSYAPYADVVWCETSEPNLEDASRFAHAIHSQYPGKLMAYNCSPSFNWKKKLDDRTIAKFQKELGLMGYKFQFITLAGFHALNLAMFELAQEYREAGMSAYAKLQAARSRQQLSRCQAPILCRHRLFRRDRASNRRREFLDHRPHRLDRRGTIYSTDCRQRFSTCEAGDSIDSQPAKQVTRKGCCAGNL
jgi:isocitrate lyase